MEPLETPKPRTQPEFAGFWLRVAAYIIDYFVLGSVLAALMVFLGLAMGLSTAIFHDMEDQANQVVIITLSVILGIMSLTASWLYYALLESGSYQGTLGKMLLNLKVTDLGGGKNFIYQSHRPVFWQVPFFFYYLYWIYYDRID